MIKCLLTLIIFAFLISCSSNRNSHEESASQQKETGNKNLDTTSLKRLSSYKFEGDSVLVSAFEIDISLSEKAKERIIGKKETIMVHVFLTGIPKDRNKVKLEEDGSFYVGSAKREIIYGQTAIFDNLKFSKKIFDQLTDKDVDLSVEFYSGRRSSPDNLLDGEGLSEKVSNVAGKKFTLNGKLIYGDK